MQLSETVLTDLTARLQSLLRRCGSLPVSHDDLIGEVILRLLSAGGSREIRNPYGYARTILQNLIRDHIRRTERAHRVLDSLAHSRPDSVSGRQEAERFDDGEVLDTLLERTELSALQATVVRMVYLDSMTLSETARQLSRNPGTVLRHLRRALEKLEKCAAEMELTQ